MKTLSIILLIVLISFMLVKYFVVSVTGIDYVSLSIEQFMSVFCGVVSLFAFVYVVKF